MQGVGFRPFVYRLATELGLNGWVRNTSTGLYIEVEGGAGSLEVFLERLEREKPRPAVVLAREVSRLAPAGFERFEILSSDGEETRTAAVLPDLATCRECLAELFDPGDRRHRYPFTNCTLCGPRYSIIGEIPYDRPNTTMRGFALCPDCAREYHDPADRRFHAQPVACPACGPQLEASIEEAARALEAGLIVALKGIGGYQLLVDALDEEAVVRLRRRKQREEKPFALLMRDLETVRRYCLVSKEEAALLESPAAPIVLLEPRPGHAIAPSVARRSPYLGVMLPYSPLHHLLALEFPRPLVATSGNRSDEPIAIDDAEARDRLGPIADFFLAHNRPIARPVDDSVVRLARGRESMLRRARGYAPLPIPVRSSLPPVLAVGAHLKNTVAIAVGRQVFVSQHIGDLDTLEARQNFERTIDDLCRLYRFRPELVACDMHPDYASTLWAHRSGLPVIAIQHHHAHVASCAAENDVRPPYLGIAWDGTGYGLDGAIWGGEIFLVEDGRIERIAHLRPFRLPGGEAAIRDCRRAAMGVCFQAGLSFEGDPHIARMLERNLNSPLTTSVGRLFDAVASLAGVAEFNRFEGQAAMELEAAIGDCRTEDAYPLPAGDWGELVRRLRADIEAGLPSWRVAARFHNALIEWIVEVARASGVRQIIMSGGVFQNRYLTEHAAARLEALGFAVYTHQRVPANDGGIALGQAVLAAQGYSYVPGCSG